MPLALLWLVLAELAACSGGGGGGGPANQSPTANAGPDQTVNAGAVVSLPGSGNDADGTIASYAWTQTAPASPTVLLANANTATAGFTAPVVSVTTVFTFKLTVSDNLGATGFDTVNVTVNPANQSPTANAGPDQLVNGGSPVTLTGGGTDIDGSVVAYSWTQTAGPSVVLNNANSAVANFTAPSAPGSVLTFQLTVTDNQSATGTDTVTITINQPPVASNVCPAILDYASAVGITLQATDPNGNGTIAYYTIDSLPSNGTITGCSSAGCQVGVSVTYNPTPNSTGKRGMDKFTFHVTDTGGLTSPAATAWILNNGKVRIMPLGDSITEGFTVGSSNLPATGFRIGYRKNLYDGLTGSYPVDFVGSRSEGLSAGILDPDHEGHPGYCAGPNGNNPTYCTTTAGNLADNISAWLDAKPADIILLHAGTNAFVTSASDVQLLLDNINTWAAANYPVKVFVARIIQTSTLNGNPSNLDITSFNNNVTTAANAPRSSITTFMVNQQTGASLTYTIDAGSTCLNGGTCTGDLADDLHPNPSGYGKMAGKWKLEMLGTGVLPTCP